ncbi:MAG TPA: PAS domain-containing protein [Planctomycetota bacterium]|nr:PAS domain-containing protein [Planctomycetota bacterium]
MLRQPARAPIAPEAGADATLVCDLEGRIVDADPAACALTGYNRDELLSRTLWDLSDPGETALARQCLEALRPEASVALEIRLRSKGGIARPFHVQMSGTLLNGRRHAVARVGWRRRAADRLPEDRDFIRAILETVGSLLLVVDPQGRIVFANRALEQALGASFRDLRGRLFWEFLPLLEAERMQALFPKLGASDFPNRYLSFLPPRDGRRRRILWSNTAMADADGRLRYVVSSGLDLNPRGAVRPELRAGEELLALITDAVPVLISYVDREERFVFNNRRFQEWFGVPPSEARGRSLRAVLGEDLDRRLRPHLEAVRAGRRAAFEIPLPLKGGEDRWIAMTYLPHLSADGRVEGFFALGTDITERKLAEDEVRRLNADLERRIELRTAELREALSEMEAFTYTVAHDLRAPLRAAAGFSQVLLEDFAPLLPEGARECIVRIDQASRRMDTLIRDLLHYSRLTRASLQPERIDPARLLKDVLESMAAEIQERRACVSVEGPWPDVLGDRTALSHVLTNLLSNAVKFVPPGAAPLVRVRAERRPGAVRIWVEDNGIGIAPEHHERIFGIFQRLHRPEEYPGTGIGLAIVRKAVERMNGRAGVESQPGEGSRFWVELPPA